MFRKKAPNPSPVSSVVLRRLEWSTMSESARAELCNRGISDIFEPSLVASIGALIEDVRRNGDQAICKALATHDRI